MNEDSKEQRKLEDSGGGLLPAVKGHSLDRIEQNRVTFEISRESYGK